ncbi:MAG: hypothetical protein C5B47_06850 [Verrucomicrobia bacterium]|nr:MAG: hypothetical protein C5B47_06850 [Verrucomicrobiota bacterium]
MRVNFQGSAQRSVLADTSEKEGYFSGFLGRFLCHLVHGSQLAWLSQDLLSTYSRSLSLLGILVRCAAGARVDAAKLALRGGAAGG